VERVSVCGDTPSSLSAVFTEIDAVPLLIKFGIALCSLLSISKLTMHFNRNGSACGSPHVKVGNIGTNNVASGWTGTSGLILIRSLIDEWPDPLVSVRTGRAGLRKLGGFAGADYLQ